MKAGQIKDKERKQGNQRKEKHKDILRTFVGFCGLHNNRIEKGTRSLFKGRETGRVKMKQKKAKTKL